MPSERRRLRPRRWNGSSRRPKMSNRSVRRFISSACCIRIAVISPVSASIWRINCSFIAESCFSVSDLGFDAVTPAAGRGTAGTAAAYDVPVWGVRCSLFSDGAGGGNTRERPCAQFAIVERFDIRGGWPSRGCDCGSADFVRESVCDIVTARDVLNLSTSSFQFS